MKLCERRMFHFVSISILIILIAFSSVSSVIVNQSGRYTNQHHDNNIIEDSYNELDSNYDWLNSRHELPTNNIHEYTQILFDFDWNSKSRLDEPCVPDYSALVQSFIISQTSHDPIVIDGDDDFELQGFPGEGTPGEPYLIDDLKINQTGTDMACIEIMNTRAFFVISECFLTGGFGEGGGISLTNVSDCLLYHNHIGYGSNGVRVIDGFQVSIANNIIYNESRAGIYFAESTGSTISGNNCTLCWDGIYLESASGNAVKDNTCQANQWGIDLYGSSNENDVIDNDCLYNIEEGILLWLGSSLNEIANNTCEYNGISGIKLLHSDNNIITMNNCSNNYYGICSNRSNSNTITENYCSLQDEMNPPIFGSGIILENSNETDVTENICEENVLCVQVLGAAYGNLVSSNNCTYYMVGIVIWFNSYSNEVSNNYCDGLGAEGGIYLAIGAHENNITQNYCVNNMYGITTDGCSQNIIQQNNCSIGDEGIYVWNSNLTVVKENLIEFYGDGIRIENGINNELMNNEIFNCTSGIFVYESQESILKTNNCTSNLIGIYLDTSDFTLIQDNFVHKNRGGESAGIALYEADFNEIIDNDCDDNYHGIYVQIGSDYNNIVGNSFSKNDEVGILVEDAYNNTIQSNDCLNNYDGILIFTGDDCYVSLNNCSLNIGVGLGFIEIINATAYRNTCYNNTGGEGWGIFLVVGESSVTENDCKFNTIGIHTEASFDTIVSDNILEQNAGIGFSLESCNNFTVTWNIFESNTQNALDNSIDITFDYNYWSNYTGPDENDDGIGDVPHNITGTANNADPHPLVYYPTAPTWVVNPTDQKLEYGNPFLYDLDAFCYAPLEWSLNDMIHFTIDQNGIITNATLLTLGSYPLEVTVTNVYGKYVSSVFTVFVDDTIAPTIDHPDDMAFDWGELGHSVIWHPYDLNPDRYELYLEMVLVESGDWNGSAITLSLDGLGYYLYEFTIVVYDIAGNNASDTVIVNIFPHTATLPTTTSTTTTISTSITSSTTSTTSTTPTTSTITDGTTIIVIIIIGGAVAILVVIVIIVQKKKG